MAIIAYSILSLLLLGGIIAVVIAFLADMAEYDERKRPVSRSG